MYNTFSNLDWKILVAICFITVFLIAAFLFFSNNSSSPAPRPTPIASPAPSLQVYSDSDYSITYPLDVTTTSTTISGGGKALIFNLPQGSDYQMDLEVLSSSSNNIEIISAIFQSFKFEENNILIDGISAKKFSGSIPVGDKTIQETAVILENKNQIYKLQLSYPSAEKNTKVEQLFSQILSGFVFH